jgi:hypothetical protein
MEVIGTTGKLAEALAKAQGEMSNPRFDKTNPHFKNKFASLAAVRDAVIPVLSKHGIACIQNVYTTEGGRVACTTSLYHGSGEALTFGPLEMPVSKADAQGFGSAATYARRYHLMAVANVVGDEDDDANQATGKPAAATEIKPGWGVHSPLGDIDPRVADLAAKYADAFRAAKTPRAAHQVQADMDNECDPDGEKWGDILKLAVWALLDSTTRSGLKKLLAQKEAA